MLYLEQAATLICLTLDFSKTQCHDVKPVYHMLLPVSPAIKFSTRTVSYNNLINN